MRRVAQAGPDGAAVAAQGFFFPHPAYREGLLLTLPPKAEPKSTGTAVNFPLRTGQKVVLRFIAEAELEKLLQRGPPAPGEPGGN